MKEKSCQHFIRQIECSSKSLWINGRTDHLFTMLSFNIKDLKNFFDFQDSPNISFVSDELLITAYKFNIISQTIRTLLEK